MTKASSISSQSPTKLIVCTNRAKPPVIITRIVKENISFAIAIKISYPKWSAIVYSVTKASSISSQSPTKLIVCTNRAKPPVIITRIVKENISFAIAIKISYPKWSAIVYSVTKASSISSQSPTKLIVCTNRAKPPVIITRIVKENISFAIAIKISYPKWSAIVYSVTKASSISNQSPTKLIVCTNRAKPPVIITRIVKENISFAIAIKISYPKWSAIVYSVTKASSISNQSPTKLIVCTNRAKPPVIITRIVKENISFAIAIKISYPKWSAIVYSVTKASSISNQSPTKLIVCTNRAKPPVIITRIVKENISFAIAIKISYPKWSAIVYAMTKASSISNQSPTKLIVCTNRAKPPVIITRIVKENLCSIRT